MIMQANNSGGHGHAPPAHPAEGNTAKMAERYAEPSKLPNAKLIPPVAGVSGALTRLRNWPDIWRALAIENLDHLVNIQQ